MLSVIISSYQPHYFSALEQNIAETIGIPYEIIKIDNPGLMGIGEAYNKGATHSVFPFLLFVHEDVEFATTKWGTKLIRHMQQHETGIAGLAGSVYVPNVPFAWWDNFEDTLMNIEQYRNEKPVKAFKLPEKTPCYTVDGVFLGCRKEVWEQVRFNEQLKKFHGYDIDFSIRTAETYQNYVIHDITVKHFSEGKPNAEWWKEVVLARTMLRHPSSQKINKKKELRYYELFQNRVDQFCPDQRKTLLLKYNNPRYIGYKAALKNLIALQFGN